jgi:hypothetical protein
VSTATLGEYEFALAFLKAAGADYHDVYLVTAVVAWERAEAQLNGGTYRYNNYLSLKDATGRLLRFSSIAAAAKAVYAILQADASRTYDTPTEAHSQSKRYAFVLQALREFAAKDTQDQQQKGLDFLTELAKSKWDSAHFGAPDGNATDNHLVAIWGQITGLPALPGETHTTVTTIKPRVPPTHRDLPPGAQQRQYIDPYAVQKWYAERHKPSPDLTGGL